MGCNDEKMITMMTKKKMMVVLISCAGSRIKGFARDESLRSFGFDPDMEVSVHVRDGLG